MALIQYAAPWDRQPQEAVEVNQGSPYAPKSGLWIPERNIVNGAGVTYGGSGSDPTQTVIQSGRALYTNGKWVQTDIAVASSTFVTWVAVIKPTAGPGGTGFSSFFQTGQYTLNWNHSNSAYRGSLTLYDNGFYPTCKFTGGFTAGVEVVIGGTYDGTTLKVFRSGVLENSLTTTNRTVGASLNALQFLGGVGGTVAFDGACSYFYWDATRALTDAQMAQLMAGIYAETIEPQTIWVPVSAGGGGATISATPGNAAADGTTASVKRTIPATPGNASASGTTASVIRVIGAAPGNAVADGTTAAVTRSIAATPGNAVADGVTATVTNSGTTTISCTPGNAAADGALAAITRTIAAAPGNAVANGAIAALLRVIATTPGNAVADGVTAAVQASVTISCTPGNAVADGVAATVTAAVSQLDLILKILRNRQELNPSTGKFTLYDDDGTTILKQSNAWADVAGTRPYSGGTLARIDALF